MSKAHDKLRVWGSDVDEGAQARRATRLPFVPAHVALMPDAHVGIGATVGRSSRGKAPSFRRSRGLTSAAG
jgi:RNA-splicing ligase RtcB